MCWRKGRGNSSFYSLQAITVILLNWIAVHLQLNYPFFFFFFGWMSCTWDSRLQGEADRSRKSVLQFYILQTLSHKRVNFVSIFSDSSALWWPNPLAGSRGSANYVHTVWYVEAGPGHLPFPPRKQWQQHQSFKYKQDFSMAFGWNEISSKMRRGGVTTSEPQWYKSYHLIICFDRDLLKSFWTHMTSEKPAAERMKSNLVTLITRNWVHI